MEAVGGHAGRVAIVTGGANGIGAAVADRLVLGGARVVRADIEFSEESMSAPDDEQWDLHLDVRDWDATARVVAKVVEVLGQVDYLVTCAGVLYGQGDLGVPFDVWEDIIVVNLTGTVGSLRAVWPQMTSQGRGAVVCIGSTAAHTGGQLSGPAYAASKGGVHSAVKWAARNGAASGIRANTIAPGIIATRLTEGMEYKTGAIPAGRFGRPEEMAEVIAFLLSDAASYVSGATFDANGGSFVR